MRKREKHPLTSHGCSKLRSLTLSFFPLVLGSYPHLIVFFFVLVAERRFSLNRRQKTENQMQEVESFGYRVTG